MLELETLPTDFTDLSDKMKNIENQVLLHTLS
jgi:hypothetical protein